MSIQKIEVRKWVSNQLNIDKKWIDELYESELGLNFMLVCLIFEDKVFDKEIKMKNINEKIENLNGNLNEELENCFSKFIERYSSDFEKLYHLCQDEKCEKKCSKKNCKMKNIIEKYKLNKKNVFSLDEKKYLLLRIAIRYRNNLFHPNKNIGTWLSKFEEQINDCIKVMKFITEEYLEVNKTK